MPSSRSPTAAVRPWAPLATGCGMQCGALTTTAHTLSGRGYLLQVVTALVYLNTPDGGAGVPDSGAGGGTGFINLKQEVAPQEGKLLVFHNCYLGSCQVHPDSVHAGLPVNAGEKVPRPPALRPHTRAHQKNGAKDRPP
jgi:hypothetical protein